VCHPGRGEEFDAQAHLEEELSKHERCGRRRIAPLAVHVAALVATVRLVARTAVSRPDLGSHRADLALEASALPPVLAEAGRCSMTTRLTATRRGSLRPSRARLSELSETKWQQSVMAARRRPANGAASKSGGAASIASRAASEGGLAVLVLPASPQAAELIVTSPCRSG